MNRLLTLLFMMTCLLVGTVEANGVYNVRDFGAKGSRQEIKKQVERLTPST